LLHRQGVTLTLDAQQLVGGVRAAGAAGALPVAAREGDRADGAHQGASLGPAGLFLASAGTAAQRRPLFSAAWILLATASASIWRCRSRPLWMTASSQTPKTAPSGAVRARSSISCTIARARRRIDSCLASTSSRTVVLIRRPCPGRMATAPL